MHCSFELQPVVRDVHVIQILKWGGVSCMSQFKLELAIYDPFSCFDFRLGGSGPVIWSYFAEFQPKSKRGSMLSFMAAFWTLGNLFVAGLAWLIIPADIGINTPFFVYNSWRIFLLICAVPSFVVAGLLFFLPESPKFLLSRGRTDEAMEIFRKIYKLNTGKDKNLYPVKQLILEDDDLKALKAIEANETVNENKYMSMIADIIENSKQLFVSPILKFTIISITINFTFHIGYYGLMMWFPELFNRFDEYDRHHPGETAGVCQVTDFVVNLEKYSDKCSDTIESAVFMESLVSLAAAIPANIIAVLGMDRLGRKFFLGKISRALIWQN